MILRRAPIRRTLLPLLLVLSLMLALHSLPATASIGDRLPEFRHCVESCIEANCLEGNNVLPLHLRLLLWDCPSNCDHTCQTIMSFARQAHSPPLPTVQFHGKWPFTRILGIQEPFSVLFSLLNLLAHQNGLVRLRANIPANYPYLAYYSALAHFSTAAWIFSAIFHTRDFLLTERLDYFAAGASVMYGFYYTPIRVFRFAHATSITSNSHSHSRFPSSTSTSPPLRLLLLRPWSILCLALYTAHISYLTLWKWNYTYNIAANVVIGITQNALWSWDALRRYRKCGQAWAAWPGLITAWILLAMGFELLDFPPWCGLDAHSLWHAGTIGPTVWWYSFLIKDAKEDMLAQRGGDSEREKTAAKEGGGGFGRLD